MRHTESPAVKKFRKLGDNMQALRMAPGAILDRRDLEAVEGLRKLALIGLAKLEADLRKVAENNSDACTDAWARIEAEPLYKRMVRKITAARRLLGVEP